MCFRCGLCCVWEARFFYDGRRVQDEDTPESLELEDGDAIEVQLERTFSSPLPLPVAC